MWKSIHIFNSLGITNESQIKPYGSHNVQHYEMTSLSSFSSTFHPTTLGNTRVIAAQFYLMGWVSCFLKATSPSQSSFQIV